MKRFQSVIWGLLFVVAGCAELQDELPPPSDGTMVVHPDGWTDSDHANFHGNAIRANDWDMRPCQQCHGADYSGGIAQVTCRTCHREQDGPEDCRTCHGSENSAPPRDLSKNTLPTFAGVGAHQPHFVGEDRVGSSYLVACSECHIVPQHIYVPGHVDTDPPAEVIISGFLATADPTVDTGPPEYDHGSFSCSNLFCHGNWTLDADSSDYGFAYADSIMKGANYSPLWTGEADEVSCGTCHGLPPMGHIPATLDECGGCHSGIVSEDGTIADPERHLNGMVNVFNVQRPF